MRVYCTPKESRRHISIKHSKEEETFLKNTTISFTPKMPEKHSDFGQP